MIRLALLAVFLLNHNLVFADQKVDKCLSEKRHQEHKYSYEEEIFLKAYCAYSEREYALAINGFSSLIDDGWGGDEVIRLRAISRYELNDMPVAISDFKRISPSNWVLSDFLFISKAYVAMGDEAEAVMYLERGVDYASKGGRSNAAGRINGSYAPDEIDLVFSLSELYERRRDKINKTRILEWGFNRNTLSVQLFDALIIDLSRSGLWKKRKYYLLRYCGSPSLASRSTNCK